MSSRKPNESRYAPLEQLLDVEEAAPFHKALEIVEVVVDQVDAVHASGRIHRAIDVDIVTFEENGRPQLGLVEGTVEFGGVRSDVLAAPPEMDLRCPVLLPDDLEEARKILRQAGSSIDPRRIDIYHLGVLLVRMLTGGSVSQYLRSSQISGRVAPAARSVIDRALGFEAANRIASCVELKNALHHIPDHLMQDTPKQSSQAADNDTPVDPPAPESSSTASCHDSKDLPFERLSHFRIIGRIGAGGMGDVYQGFDETLGRPVAIKVLPAELGRQDEFVRRFRAEARAAAEIAHPNIVPIYFVGQDGQHNFFAMQYVQGESLADRLKRDQQLSVEDAIHVIEDCLRGLNAAHERGIVHRDIKPGNVLLESSTARAMLADFGLVHRMGQSTRLTVTGMVMGTVDYIAPEQARGQPVDRRTDLYSLGVLLYQLLSGRLPFEAETPTAMLFQHAYEQPLPLQQAAANVPKPLVDIVSRLMAKRLEDRYPNCKSALADLMAFRTGEPITSPSPEPTSSVISVPDFGATPSISEFEQSPSVSNWWQVIRERVAILFNARVPAVLQELQGTEQRVDGAVAEYERRRDKLAQLVDEAESVARELDAQAYGHKQAAEAARGRETASASEAEKLDAQQDYDHLQQAAADVAARAEEQKEQLAEMRLQLAQVNARVLGLRSQRDALNARLRAAKARLKTNEPPHRQSRWPFAATVFAGLICLGLVIWKLVSTSSDVEVDPATRAVVQSNEVSPTTVPTGESGKSSTPVANALPVNTSIEDWAFVPDVNDWEDRFAYVDPRATLKSDSKGVHVAVQKPLDSILLAYRRRLVGDFQLELDLKVQSTMGPLPTASQRRSRPPIRSKPIRSNMIPRDPRSLPWVGLRPPSEGQRTNWLAINGNMGLLPSGIGEMKLVVEKTNGAFSYRLDGVMQESMSASDVDVVYFVMKLFTPASLTIKRVELKGKTDHTGYELPQITAAQFDPPSWRTSMSTTNWRFGRVDDIELTIDTSVQFENHAQNGTAHVRYNKLLDGDLYILAKLGLEEPLTASQGTEPTVKKAGSTAIECSIMGVNNRESVTLPTQVKFPIGSNHGWITIVRSGDRMWSTCDSVAGQHGRVSGPVFFDVHTKRRDSPVRIEELFVYSENIADIPEPPLLPLAADGWKVDTESRRWNYDDHSGLISLTQDGNRVRVVDNDIPVPIERLITFDVDFEVTLKLVIPPLEFFANTESRGGQILVLVKPDSTSGSAVSVQLPGPIGGKESAHSVKVRRIGNMVTLSAGSLVREGTIDGPLVLALDSLGKTSYWISDYQVKLLP
ncbi:MAG: protein kinase [Pirellulaceae bacterium]|nr:protein kinase [Pirellulaceae bacterium]